MVDSHKACSLSPGGSCRFRRCLFLDYVGSSIIDGPPQRGILEIAYRALENGKTFDAGDQNIRILVKNSVQFADRTLLHRSIDGCQLFHSDDFESRKLVKKLRFFSPVKTLWLCCHIVWTPLLASILSSKLSTTGLLAPDLV